MAAFDSSSLDLRALIVFENDDFIVITKPAGLLVHPVAADSVALTQFLPQLGDAVRLCHRLDRETSGCLLLGKHDAALKLAGGWLTKGLIEKTYAALVSPAPPKDAGEITFPLKKIADRMRPAPDGQTAITLWSVVKRQEKAALLELSPKTGRTHQLRAHLAAAGWPILGDVFYGGSPAPRLMLHATTLALPTGEVMNSPLPAEFSVS